MLYGAHINLNTKLKEYKTLEYAKKYTRYVYYSNMINNSGRIFTKIRANTPGLGEIMALNTDLS